MLLPSKPKGSSASPGYTARKRILFVAMANSIHVARWLELLKSEPFDARLISSNASTSIRNPKRSVHELIRPLLTKRSASQQLQLTIPIFSKFASSIMWRIDRFTSDWVRGFYIWLNIMLFRPHLVHVLELQNGGYPVLRAYSLLPKNRRPLLFVTNYGSDVYWYRNFPSHNKRLRKLLNLANAYSAECQRDVVIARELGFTGCVLRTCPVTGGLNPSTLPDIQSISNLANRTTIVVKGYQGTWGQAVEALDAIAKANREIISRFKIEVYSCDSETELAAGKLKGLGLDVLIYGHGVLGHSEMLDLFQRSRVYLGLSRSDGISTSMLEAMSQGAVPIQTDTACASEWIRSKRDGYVVSLDDQMGISRGLEKILSDDEFAHNAQLVNQATIREKYDQGKIRELVNSYYAEILGSSTSLGKE
mgnify:CR=1 FL=1